VRQDTASVALGGADVDSQKLASTRRTLRYVAAFYGFLALLCIPMPLLLGFMIASDDLEADAGLILFGGIVLLVGTLLVIAAMGLWRQRYRWAVLLVTGLLMLAFPIGTIVGGITLALVYGGAGKRLFAAQQHSATRPAI
jgi:hypothetical protein